MVSEARTRPGRPSRSSTSGGRSPLGHVGDGHPLEHRPEADPDGHPDLAQLGGRPGELEHLGPLASDVGERALDRPDHVGQR